MNQQPGCMGVAEGLALVAFTNITTVFLSTPSMMVDKATTAAWMGPLIQYAVSIIILFMLLFIFRKTSENLFEASKALIGTFLTKIITLYFIAVFLLEAGLLLRQFAENTLLTALPQLPFEIAIAWYAIIAVVMCYIGLEPIARSAYIILPMVILFGLAVLLMLLPQYQWLYLMPWNGPGLDKVVKANMQSLGINVGMLIPFILANAFQTARTIKSSVVYGLGISCIFKSITLASYLAAFGTGAGREKVLPFYELARLVYISRYIQRIEALIILLWVISGVLNIAIASYIALYLLGQLFNLPTLRPLIVPLMIVVAQLSMLPGEIISVLKFHHIAQVYIYSVGVLIFPVILFIPALFKKRSNSS